MPFKGWNLDPNSMPPIAELSSRRASSVRAHLACHTAGFSEFTKGEIEQSIADRFEKQVEKYPDKIAVECDQKKLTYTELNQSANRIARAILARMGRGAEAVALFLDSRVLSIAAILGVLKSGKFYLPLEPSYPPLRNRALLGDSRSRCILTESSVEALAQELTDHDRDLMPLDKGQAGLESDNLGLRISPDDYAYILYTSGSTGEPKGVIQNHRNVLHFMMNYTNGLQVSPEDRLSLLYSWGNSAAMMDTFAALLNGASIHPFRLREEGTGRLAKWLVDSRITVYHSVASVFRSFISSLGGQEKFPALRLIDFGGEAVIQSDVESYRRHFSRDCALVNGFGTTEINVVRQYFIDQNTEITGALVPVGYPVEDTGVLLLNESGAEVEAGSVGEICIESPYLALGYLGKPEVTSAAFSTSPKGGGRRVYRTGDLGRMESDGCLTHLGRKDFQVKIRGHRVETAEVEVVLRRTFGLEDAVVTGSDFGGGDLRLVAYLVTGDQPEPSQRGLRDELARVLPEFMIPSAFVMLEALPKTPNGKVDRRALPAPAGSRPKLETVFVAPRSSFEELLAGVWKEVLKVDEIGIHDNFFELGGNSLTAAQVISRLRSAIDLELPLRDFFAAPTLQGLALMVVQARAEQVGLSEASLLLDELEESSRHNTQGRPAQESEQA
jgi:amino acid adenylation domain-containing protein